MTYALLVGLGGQNPPTPRLAQFVGGPRDGEMYRLPQPCVYVYGGSTASIRFCGEGQLYPTSAKPRTRIYQVRKWRGCWDALPVLRLVLDDEGAA